MTNILDLNLSVSDVINLPDLALSANGVAERMKELEEKQIGGTLLARAYLPKIIRLFNI